MNQNLLERPEQSEQSAAIDIRQKQLDTIAEQKERLVESTELREVVAEVLAIRKSLQDPNVADTDAGDLVAYETDFAGVRNAMRMGLDFRTNHDGSYGERWEADVRAKEYLMPEMTPELEAKIYDLAEQFGLTGDSEPKNPNVDAALVLGGGGKSPLDRTLYAKELIDSGKIVTDTLIALGSERPVNDAERERAGEYAKDAQTEFELLVKATEVAYGITIDDEDMTYWSDHSIEHDVPHVHKVITIPATEDHPNIFIISSAVTTDPFVDTTVKGKLKKILRNRANTKDTFKTLHRLANFKPGSRVAAVTNQHFAPFQGAVAAGELGKMGIETEVVGFDPKHFGNPPKTSYELLQEILSVADSLENAK